MKRIRSGAKGISCLLTGPDSGSRDERKMIVVYILPTQYTHSA